MSKKTPAPFPLSFLLPEDIAKSPEKLEKEVSEQSLLMAALSNSHLEELSRQVESLKDPKSKPPVYHVALPETMRDKFSRDPNGGSGAVDLLDKINGKLLSPPGSVKKDASGNVTIKTPVDFFNHIHTHTLSSMIHKAEISLALRSVGTGLIEKEIPFNFTGTGNRSKSIDYMLKDVDEMLKTKYERGFGVSIEDISITADGQDPALSKFVTCEISVKVPSGRYLESFVNNSYDHPSLGVEKELFVEDLFYTDKHSSNMPNSKHGHKAEIKLKLGYSEPLLEGLDFQTKHLIKDNLENLTNTFYLKPSIYNMTIDSSGSLVFSIKYHSTLDADMDRREGKAFEPSHQTISRQSKSLRKLYFSLKEFERNNPTEDTTAVNDFLAYTKATEAVAAENSKINRCTQWIDKITDFGNRILALPYYSTNYPEPTRKTFTDRQQVKESTKERKKISHQLQYVFDSPMLRSVYSSSDSNTIGILNRGEPIKAVEFVLLGDIIDEVFKKILSSSELSHEAALFSAFSFNMYDSITASVVDKVIAMKNVPVSVDLLWDLLYNSKITDTDEIDVSNLNYYTDLVSKAYSTIYSSCDHAIRFLSSRSSLATASQSVRKVGAAEINAYEIYIPKQVFVDTLHPARNRKENNRELLSSDLDDILSKKNDRGSNARLMLFSSHIPFVSSDKTIRPSDFIFKSFGQYGIVKNFSYSSVDIDGLLESHIVSRAQSKPGKIDEESQYREYKMHLKLEISTFGYPTVIPGMIVEVDKVILATKPLSALTRTLRNRFFVTRVSTSMNKSEYTTRIEGYPLTEGRAKDIRALREEEMRHNSFFKEEDQGNIAHLLESFSNYQSSQREQPINTTIDEDINKYFRQLANPNYFPGRMDDLNMEHTGFSIPPPIDKRLPILGEVNSWGKRVARDASKPYAHPGNWAHLKPKLPLKGNGGMPIAFEVVKKLENNSDYKYDTPLDPIEFSISDAKDIQTQASKHISDIEKFLPITRPSDNILDYGAHLEEIFRALINSHYANAPYPIPLSAKLAGLKVIDIALDQWRVRINQLATTSSDDKVKAMFGTLLKDSHELLSDNNSQELKALIENYESYVTSLADSLDNSNSLIDIIGKIKKEV